MTIAQESIDLRTPGERHGTWYSFDAPYQRLRVFSIWTIIGFGIAVCLGLVLVYPHKTLEQRLASSEHNQHADRLTIEYLKVFLNAEPKATTLRSALIDQLMRLGSYDEARVALAPLLQSSDAAVHLDAEWLELKILELEAYAVRPDRAEYAERMARMRAQLALLLRLPQDAQHLLVLARKALSAGQVEVAAQAYQKLAARREPLAPEIYAEAAHATLGLRDYSTAAALYFHAMERTQAIEQRRDYFITALKTLQAGARYDELVAAADSHIGPLAHDTATLLFLARMAQAANKLDAAERYAKQLLQLSWFEQHPLPFRYAQADYRLASFETLSPRSQRSALRFMTIADQEAAIRPGNTPGLPFDDEAYSLAYNIFLAHRNLDDARRVAAAAVQQQPDNAVWRKRLAEVNSWNNAPAAALPQWLAYAQLSGDEKAWDTVLQLGTGLSDIDAQLAAIEHKAVVDRNNPVWLDRLVQTLEAQGAPERALALLRERVHESVRPTQAHDDQRQHTFELLAGLAERTGHDQETLATLRSLQKEFGPSSSYALRIANQLYRVGDNAGALAELEQAVPNAPTNDAAFWRAYAELARLLQNDVSARQGYRSLLASDTQNEDDLANLIALLEAQQPAAAARLAEYAFSKNGKTRWAVQALNLSVRTSNWIAARVLLARLTPEQLRSLEQDPRFLTLRASIAQASNDLDAAERDLRAALALRPGDMDTRAALIWVLIANRSTAQLKSVLQRWGSDAENNRVLWDPFAAALMAINRQREALHWFNKSAQPLHSRRDDYLWLMSYAEALDANAQQDMAWRIRRHVWNELRKPEVLRAVNPQQLGTLRDRLVALSPLFMNGDGAERVIQALLRADVGSLLAPMPSVDLPSNGRDMLALIDQLSTRNAGAPVTAPASGMAAPAPSLNALFKPGSGTRPHDDARLTASARELALAYALNRNANDLAAAWYATRFADQLSKPLWGELALMLAAEDRSALDRLLDTVPDWLPMYDRIEAAQRAGRPALAQTLAFDQLALLPDDEELHLRLTNLTTESSAQVPANFSIDVTRQTQAPLNTLQSHLQSGVALSPGLRLGIDFMQRKYSSSDDTALTNLPNSDRQLELGLRKTLDSGSIAARLTQRRSSGANTDTNSNTGARIDYNTALTTALNIIATFDLHQYASESALLRAGAQRDGFETNATYAITHNEYVRLDLNAHRYISLAGAALGRGNGWNAEFGTHLRIEYPNLSLRFYTSGSAYKDRGNADTTIARLLPASVDPSTYRVLPMDDRVSGISLGIGTVIENHYSRAWRPFAEVGLSHSQSAGSGYTLRAGLAGSVLGNDLLSVRGLRVNGTAAAPKGSQEFGLDYQLFF